MTDCVFFRQLTIPFQGAENPDCRVLSAALPATELHFCQRKKGCQLKQLICTEGFQSRLPLLLGELYMGTQRFNGIFTQLLLSLGAVAGHERCYSQTLFD